MSVKIALAGNPNSGKTTLFNDLTGANQYVGNWPGVTVEKKDGVLKSDKNVIIQDLPGIYSLSPYSMEEVVARTYLVDEKPDAILNIVDGTNIERNLYLSTQLAELGIPMVIAVNMMDLVEKNGDKLDFEKIANTLGCKVVGISAFKGKGCVEAAAAAVELAGRKKGESPHVFTGSVEHALAHIEESIQGKVDHSAIRYFAIKIFERDRKIVDAVKLDPATIAHIEDHIKDCEKELNDDAESIITNQRYEFIKDLMDKTLSRSEKRKNKTTLSDKIDSFVTNRIIAIPIFVVSLLAMYWIAVSDGGPGTVLTDWANDGFLGDGWFLPFTQREYKSASGVKEKPWFEGMDFDTASGTFEPHGVNIEKWQNAYKAAYDEKNGEGAYEKALAAFNGKAEKEFKPEKKGDEFEPSEFEVLDEKLAAAVKTEDCWLEDVESGEIRRGKMKIENGKIEIEKCECGEGDDCKCKELKWTCDYPMYQASTKFDEPDPSGGFGVWVPGVGALMGSLCEKCGIAEGTLAYALINDGVVGGVCTVLGFIPVIAIVFLFLAFLEDCGYMARVAFIMDRIFRKFGLSGKSFVPMIVGKGCGVPAVYATRTIENERDRRMTIILATFMPCGAKTVITTMFAAIFFREYWWIAALMDLTGIAIVVLGGIALKKTRAFAGEAAPFVMELPAYHMPTVKGLVIHTWERVKAYTVKAGVIIFPCCVALTFMMTFDWKFNVVGDAVDQSILASVGNWIAWFFAPLGFGNWQGAAASVSAEIAKEQATATLAMVACGDGSAAQNVMALFKSFGPYVTPAALSFLLFNLFIPPCLVAIVATFKEMGKLSWGWIAFFFQMFVGYTLALNAYQIGALVCGGSFGIWSAVTILVDLACLWAILRPARKTEVE